MRFEITTLLILPKRVYLCNIMFTALAFGSIFVVAGGGGGFGGGDEEGEGVRAHFLNSGW